VNTPTRDQAERLQIALQTQDQARVRLIAAGSGTGVDLENLAGAYVAATDDLYRCAVEIKGGDQ
jgi:hypothetical protein